MKKRRMSFNDEIENFQHGMIQLMATEK